jgi:hypothetical protein
MVTDSLIDGNSAARSGGGIHVPRGDLTVIRSEISNNIAAGTGYAFEFGSGNGGGIYNRNSAFDPYNLTVADSTISGNSAFRYGGGIYCGYTASTVTGSTISGNHANRTYGSVGGGIFARGSLSVSFSTISSNSTNWEQGSGGIAVGGFSTMTHSIVAGNTRGAGAIPHDVGGGGIFAVAFSLLGVAPFALTDNGGNLLGTSAAPIDPLLGPLADNGGPTRTHALLPGSPAINRGDLNAVAGVGGVPEFDQRSAPFGRIFGGRIDIGAFEQQPAPAALFGDYNQDNIADLADYIVWRRALGQTVPRYSGADGNGDGIIDELDLAVWRAHFGQTVPSPVAPSDLNLVVDTLADESDGNYALGDLSLREALLLANTYPSVDTISFAPALTVAGPATILLTMRELKITDSTSILGPGANLLTIDASGNDPTPDMNNGDGSRIFNITDDANNTVLEVSISGLTLTGGDVSGAGVASNGGAIRSLENLTVTDSTISGNSSSGNLTSGATFSGGGIYARGDLTITASTISGNSAGGDGGGIRAAGASLLITNSTLSGNSAGVDGGAISNYGFGPDRTVVVINSTLSGNSAGGQTFSDGGAIWMGGGSLTVTDSLISNNSAPSGGGIRISDGSLTIVGSTITGNSAIGPPSLPLRGDGGGIWTLRSNLTIAHSTISGNSAPGTPSFGGSGGGIWTYGGNRTVVDSTISGNSARLGGGVWSSSSGILTVTRSTISNNSAANEGGGLWAMGRSSTVLLSHALVAENTRGASDRNDVTGSVNLAFSLLGVDTGAMITDNGGNLIGTAAAPIDPLLGPLVDNGGPTFTHALLAGSPAINRGDLSAAAGVGGVPEFDQRGTPFGRVVNGRIDVGAFESQPIPPAIFGDYNGDGGVDAGDYVVWRKMFGSNVANYTAADGNGMVGAEDHDVWAAHFGETFEENGTVQATSDPPATSRLAEPAAMTVSASEDATAHHADSRMAGFALAGEDGREATAARRKISTKSFSHFMTRQTCIDEALAAWASTQPRREKVLSDAVQSTRGHASKDLSVALDVVLDAGFEDLFVNAI